ncbi:MAG: hypothetical protein ABI769_08590 [Pseudomonadota bacterium]
MKRLQLERARTSTTAPRRSQASDIITGRLEAHGAANYQFRRGGSPSYYVTVSSIRGPETFWGVDLGRAIKESKSQPAIGSVIGLQRVGSEPVTLPAGDPERAFRRTLWRVEGVEFLAESIERARKERESQLDARRALQERPELRNAFVSLRIAERFAESHIRDPRDREIFVERVKAVMALSARSGVPAPRPRSPSAPQPPRRDEPTR